MFPIVYLHVYHHLKSSAGLYYIRWRFTQKELSELFTVDISGVLAHLGGLNDL